MKIEWYKYPEIKPEMKMEMSLSDTIYHFLVCNNLGKISIKPYGKIKPYGERTNEETVYGFGNSNRMHFEFDDVYFWAELPEPPEEVAEINAQIQELEKQRNNLIKKIKELEKQLRGKDDEQETVFDSSRFGKI